MSAPSLICPAYDLKWVEAIDELSKAPALRGKLAVVPNVFNGPGKGVDGQWDSACERWAKAGVALIPYIDWTKQNGKGAAKTVDELVAEAERWRKYGFKIVGWWADDCFLWRSAYKPLVVGFRQRVPERLFLNAGCPIPVKSWAWNQGVVCDYELGDFPGYSTRADRVWIMPAKSSDWKSKVAQAAKAEVKWVFPTDAPGYQLPPSFWKDFKNWPS